MSRQCGLTATFTVWAVPEVAPARSATITAKLARGSSVPSWRNITVPLLEVGLREGVDRVHRVAGERNEAVPHLRNREGEVAGGIVGIESGEILQGDAHGPALVDSQIQVARNRRRDVAQLGRQLPAHLHGELAVS